MAYCTYEVGKNNVIKIELENIAKVTEKYDATAQANKRSIDAMLEDSSASSTTTTTSNNNTTTTTSEEVAGVRSDKKYKIVAGNETNVDNVTNKNVNSNNE